MAGVPAAVLLVLTSLTGLFLGKRVASREDVVDSGKPAKLIVLSVATGLVALVFHFLQLANLRLDVRCFGCGHASDAYWFRSTSAQYRFSSPCVHLSTARELWIIWFR